jgi:oligopeptide transport system permease protein
MTGTGHLAAALRRFGRSRASLVAAAVLVLVGFAVLVGPPLVAALGLDGTTPDPRLGAAPPSLAHPAGTDVLGRDLLARTLEGGRVALRVGLLASSIAFVIGVSWGAAAGLAGGLVDAFLMRTVDVLASLPQLVVAIVVLAISRSRSEMLLCLLIGAISWLTLARVVRAQVRVLRQSDYVVAARALGASGPRLLVRHILPGAAGTLLVYATLLVPAAMLEEAFLSFLGLGVQAPGASWGTLVQEGAAELVVYPWLLAVPGAAMAVVLLAWNFVGDGLRDAVSVEEG